MQKSKLVPLNGRGDITIKELTIAEIMSVVEQAESAYKESAPPHVLDMLFPEGLPALAVALSAGLSLEQLSGFSPDEYARLREAAAGLNPIFLAMWERLSNVGRDLAARMEGRNPQSSETLSAASSAAVTLGPGNMDTASS